MGLEWKKDAEEVIQAVMMILLPECIYCITDFILFLNVILFFMFIVVLVLLYFMFFFAVFFFCFFCCRCLSTNFLRACEAEKEFPLVDDKDLFCPVPLHPVLWLHGRHGSHFWPGNSPVSQFPRRCISTVSCWLLFTVQATDSQNQSSKLSLLFHPIMHWAAQKTITPTLIN